MKILVAGWFSFEDGHATAGDLLVRDLVCEWIETAGARYDVALAKPFEGGVDLLQVDPTAYSHLVFVCGPFQQGKLEAKLFERFNQCRIIGVNLTMKLPLSKWNPFDCLIERDSSARANPDLSFLSRRPAVPIVGVCLLEDSEGVLTQIANAAIERLRAAREIAFVMIDTRLDINGTGLRTPAEVESLLGRMDAVITTRLHGTVLALKHGVPAIAIDPVPGGGKITRQTEQIGWPVCFNAIEVTDRQLIEALEYCLSSAAREKALECTRNAESRAEEIRADFIRILQCPAKLEESHASRMANPPDASWMDQFLNQPKKPDAEPTPRRTFKSRVANFFRSNRSPNARTHLHR